MIQDYPITPPASLVQTWVDNWHSAKVKHEELIACVARQAVNWGADQQLAEDAKWLDHNALNETHLTTIPVGDLLKEAMRPKPPSLKAQALKELKDWTDEKHGPGGEVFLCEGLSVALIREALESLPD